MQGCRELFFYAVFFLLLPYSHFQPPPNGKEDPLNRCCSNGERLLPLRPHHPAIQFMSIPLNGLKAIRRLQPRTLPSLSGLMVKPSRPVYHKPACQLSRPVPG